LARVLVYQPTIPIRQKTMDQAGTPAVGKSEMQLLPHAVFICHASHDKKVADGACAALELDGVRCWIAPRDVLAGRPYAAQITEAIRSAQILVLILSRESNRSKQALREVERAIHCQLQVLTFRIEQIEPNDDLSFFLSADHCVEASSGPSETYCPALLRQTIALLQARPESAEGSEPAPPEIYGNFRILRRSDGSLFRLGKGGMGVTWKAIDVNLDRPVALKVIGVDLLNSTQARSRFLREAQAAAKMHHPHVATVHHFGQEGDAYFYAMEFVEGEDLERYVARHGPLSPAMALQVVLQVAQALEAAHSYQLIHRDIKPANIMATVNRAGSLEVKLVDFGLAKGAGAKDFDMARITRSQDFVGSPAFASPEQCKMGELDTRSDIYSLGVTLWYLLTGKRPFTGTVGQVMIAHAVQPPAFEQLNEVSEPVLELLKRMLAKNPEERPQSPQELQTAVLAAAARLATEFNAVPERIPVEAAREELPPDRTFEWDGAGEPEQLYTIASPLFDGYLSLELGSLVGDRYRLVEEEREGTGGRFFLAQDEKSTGGKPFQVGLKIVHPGVIADPGLLDLMENELGVIGRSPHPHVVKYVGLERKYQTPFIIREWVHGFLMYDLLRWRGSFRAAELQILLEPLAATLDFVSGQGFGLVEVSVRKILVACPEDLHPDRFADFARRDVHEWNHCTLKLNPLSIAPLLYRRRANRPQQTLVPTSQVLSLTQAEAGVRGIKVVRLYGRLVYELLSGHAPVRGDSQRYSPLSELNERGNATLRSACIEGGQSEAFRSCTEFWNALKENLAGRSCASTVPVSPPIISAPAAPASLPPQPSAPTSSPPATPPPKRNLIVGSILGGALIIGLAIFAAIRFGGTGSSPASTATPTPVEEISTPVPTTTPVPSTPTPIPSTPAPIPSTPAPIPSTPAPIPSTPAPIPSTPSPIPPTPVVDPVREAEIAEQELGQAWSALTEAQRDAIRQEEREWIKMKDNTPIAERAQVIRARTSYLQNLARNQNNTRTSTDPVGEVQIAEQQLNQAWRALTERQREAIRQDEREWINMKDSTPIARRAQVILARVAYLRNLARNH
jgi:serine/threonine protein kinase